MYLSSDSLGYGKKLSRIDPVSRLTKVLPYLLSPE